jgi:A/G-specific adenine glycosylase
MAWGKDNQRDFAWRHAKDPYEVFVAECLVQRTKASQVEPIYREFLKNWPDFISLSKATHHQVTSVIRPLGLEYRAKRIRTIAKLIVHLFGATIPDDLNELKRLYGKGLGDYTAHAILCFAYGQNVPVVDTNVERILKRVFSVRARKDGHRDRRLWAFAAQLVPRGKAKYYNWSMLDFGALVCPAKNPLCSSCPILEICDYGQDRIKRTDKISRN